METEEIISKEKLTEDGWGSISSFARCEIWEKLDKRLLWDPKTEEVILRYERKQK